MGAIPSHPSPSPSTTTSTSQTSSLSSSSSSTPRPSPNPPTAAKSTSKHLAPVPGRPAQPALPAAYPTRKSRSKSPALNTQLSKDPEEEGRGGGESESKSKNKNKSRGSSPAERAWTSMVGGEGRRRKKSGSGSGSGSGKEQRSPIPKEAIPRTGTDGEAGSAEKKVIVCGYPHYEECIASVELAVERRSRRRRSSEGKRERLRYALGGKRG